MIWSKHAKDSEWVKNEISAVSSQDYSKIEKFSFKLDNNTKLPPLHFAPNRHFSVTLDNVEEITEKQVVQILAGAFESQIKSFKERVKYDFEHFSKDNKNYDPVIKGFKNLMHSMNL